MIIYKLTCKLNNKIYIGQTVRTLNERLKEHKTHNKTLISRAIRKYGIDNFTAEIIDTAETIEELNQKEIDWIKYYDCIKPNGYNQCQGGDNSKGFKHREESKARMSRSKSKLYIGANNPFYGKTHSDEQKAKWSRERKGRDMTKVTEASKPSCVRKVMNVDTGEVFNSIVEGARKYNIKPTHITSVCRGKRKRTGGYHWKYVD